MIALHLASGKGKLGEGRLLVEKALQPANGDRLPVAVRDLFLEICCLFRVYQSWAAYVRAGLDFCIRDHDIDLRFLRQKYEYRRAV
jgi:hypothetical protein